MAIKSLRCVTLTAILTAAAFGQTLAPMRPPAVPLVAHDPYFSIWSDSDHLTDSGTVHWTGKPNTLFAMVRVDGKSYRVMGRDRQPTPALDQTSLQVLPTRTIYEFAGAGVKVGLTFLTPALPDDLDVLSRPLTYIEWNVNSADGRDHAVSIYFEAGADLVVNTPDEQVESARYQLDGQPILRMGSRSQPVLAKRGDDLRIDWGYLYLAPDKSEGASEATVMRQQARQSFEKTGSVPDSDDFSEHAAPRRGSNEVLALAFDLGKVGSQPASRYLMIAYDDLFSIEYFYRKERPWWRRNGDDASDLLRKARHDHESLAQRSATIR